MTTENSIKLSEITDISTNQTKLADFLEIQEHIEDVITEENGDAVFECKVDGVSQPICSWYKNGKLIISCQRTKITSNTKWHRLEISKVNAADHGVYSIVCRNSSKQLSSKANLFVARRNLHVGVFYPHNLNSKGIGVVNHLRNVKVSKGDRIELEAMFQLGAINDNYTWFKNSEVIQQDERTIILNSKNSTILSILKSELTDSGVYFVVAKTTQGIMSSFADVQVTAVKEYIHDDEELPIIEELLPHELETNENEDIRLICKATINIKTSIMWQKNGVLIGKSNFTPQDYGNRYIGLKGVKVSRTDTGNYSLILRDEETGREETTCCFLTVKPSPTINPPVPELRRPLESVVACCGSKVTFDCSFALADPTYYYVVWHVGHYRVERTNSRFSVINKGGECMLYIKKLEPGMCGEVVCELRKALLNQKSVHVTSTSANIALVPISIVKEEKANSLTKKGKLYNDTAPCVLFYSIAIGNNSLTYFNTLTRKTFNSNGNHNVGDIILEINYCRLDDEGLFYLHSSSGHSEVITHRLVAYDKTRSPTIVAFEWEDNTIPTSWWYGIDLGQTDGSYVEAGVSSLPSFEVKDPPMERMMSFRVRTVPSNETSDSTVCIVPTPGIIMKPPKSHKLRPMEEFEQSYTNTEDLIGSGAFGSVVLVRDVTGEHYAAKVLKTMTQKKRDTAMREFEVMKKLRHPKLVELIDAFVAKDSFILVMDYLWGGELFDRIVDEEYIKEIDVVPYVRQICEALQYLHSHKIAHLDLKPENIVCLSPNSGQVKIIDFGIARVLEDGHITRAMYGTRDYVAPEVLNFEPLTLASDMWSLGVVTYVLLSGVMPFHGETWSECSANIILANYNYNVPAFREISDLAKNFVDQLLVHNAHSRMSATLSLNHKWITKGPPKGAKAGHMKQTRENLKTYLATYRARWQRAGNVMIAAHRLRTQAGSTRASSEKETPPSVT